MIRKKYKTLPRLEASAGIIAMYQKSLKAEVQAMKDSVEKYLKSKLKVAAEAVTDADPVKELQRQINKLKEQYARRLKILSKDLPVQILKQIQRDAERRFKNQIKTAKPEIVSINFEMTPKLKIISQAFIEQNVSLIRTIPEKYFGRIEQTIMNGLRNNEGTGILFEKIAKDYDVTENQAALIATDQTKKLHEEIVTQRRIELGIYKAFWRHSPKSKVPRKKHLEADGKEYDIRKGCYIDGEWIQPKEKINCDCWQQAILP
jgi:uncharacterized protein with gpF-like domain